MELRNQIPGVLLRSGQEMSLIGMGTATSPFPQPHRLTSILVDAIEVGYRHFDTAAHYASEEPLGRAVAEAVARGLIKGRSEVFITSKLRCKDNHPDLVLPAINKILHKLGMEYVDLYLVHWPVRLRNEAPDNGFRWGGCCSIGDMKRDMGGHERVLQIGPGQICWSQQLKLQLFTNGKRNKMK